jgi:hypothetical protein
MNFFFQRRELGEPPSYDTHEERSDFERRSASRHCSRLAFSFRPALLLLVSPSVE